MNIHIFYNPASIPVFTKCMRANIDKKINRKIFHNSITDNLRLKPT